MAENLIGSDPERHTYLAGGLEEIGIAERGAKAENVISFRVFGDRLHDGTVDDDQMFWGRLHRSTFARIARVKQQGCSFQTYPVTFPTPFPRQLDLMFFS